MATRSLSALLLLVGLFHPIAAQRSPIPGLESTVEKALREWSVPGAAIAIVKNDVVVYERGFGVRTLGASDKVDQHTIFSIASTTKAMTAACLGMLVDDGKLAWDDPVTKWLPEFALSDPYVTRHVTVRDLLTHRSGLPRGDMLWYGSGHDRAEILRRVRHLQPAWGFRARYGYQNIMVMAAGEVVRAVSGMSWDAFIKERLFVPLGMTRSSTSVRAFENVGNIATPHEVVDDTVRAVRWPNYDNIGGAGSGNSTAHDMAQWARLLLNNGVYEGKRFLAAKTVEELMSPQTINRLDSTARALRPSSHFLTYGLGWGLVDYQGRKIATHDGWLDGMRSRIMLVPEEKLGVVILLNGPRAALHTVLAYQIVDHYLGAPKKDWSAEYRRMAREDEKQAAENKAKREEKRVKDTSPAMPLASYVGTYRSELYGDVTVRIDRGAMVITYGDLYVGDLVHRHFETFQVNWRDRVLGWDEVMFTHGFDGTVTGLEWSEVGSFGKRAIP